MMGASKMSRLAPYRVVESNIVLDVKNLSSGDDLCGRQSDASGRRDSWLLRACLGSRAQRNCAASSVSSVEAAAALARDAAESCRDFTSDL